MEINEILGEFDELNSFIGLAKASISLSVDDNVKLTNILTAIQHQIFMAQAEISHYGGVASNTPRLDKNHIYRLEQQTASIEQRLATLQNFILPEGTLSGCYLHYVRALARRTERSLLKNIKFVDIDHLTEYLDRLACLAFAMARLVNQSSMVSEQKPDYQS